MIHLDGVAAPDWHFPFCPEPPDFTLDWPAIAETFAFVRAMQGVMQDADYHAEGDVFTHTRMVAEALIADDHWRRLPPPARHALFAAVLFHDAGKVSATTTDDADGSISSRGHTRHSQRIARRVMWRELPTPVPFAWRETVVNLVRFHGLPLNLMRAADPERTVIETSLLVPTDWLAIHADADVRGRICEDRQGLLDTVELFRDECRRQECFGAAREFVSAHTRFCYFHQTGRTPDVEAYDDTVADAILLAGLPGTGKDTWLRETIADGRPIISLDAIREEMGISPSGNQGAVVDRAKEIAKEFLRAKQPFAWNATNISGQLRGQLIERFADYKFRTRIVYLDADWDTIRERNRSRGPRAVPEAVIARLAEKLDVPNLTEAQTVEWRES